MLLKINEVAERLNCSGNNVRALIDNGMLAVIPTGAGGGGLRVEASELDRFIDERRHHRGKDASRFPAKLSPVKLRHLR